MDELKQKLNLLSSLRTFVETKNNYYYNYTIINEKPITQNTISIVMTSHERSKQVYCTLETINICNFKDIHIIIVDDSSIDPILETVIEKFNLHIELISINRQYKYWTNPCINYNIGFQYIKGNKVIIQNSEVCYIGDIIEYTKNNIIDDNYYVFDVKASRDFNTNELIYAALKTDKINVGIYNENIYSDRWQGWYQHVSNRNGNYHFLTALTKKTFDKIGGFSYDYAFGSCYDDDDYLLKISSNNINIINVNNEIYKIGGIHLYHGYTTNSDAYSWSTKDNYHLFNKKKNYLNKNGVYLELSIHNSIDDINNMYNILNNY
jgi:glycosyltransferase involved in cell wall biosynthesis